MATFKFLLYKSNVKRDGLYPVCLRITKNRKLKYISLNMYASEDQWNEEAGRYKKNKRVNPDCEKYNILLNHYEERKDNLVRQFIEDKIDWTLNQLEERFLGASKKGKIYDYWVKQIEIQRVSGHDGNARAYKAGLHILEKYDKKIKERLFSEIDIRYVNALNVALERDGCRGNTRFGYIKTLRLILNKAIVEKVMSKDTYPFGEGGFSVNSLKEETRKRYLMDKDLLLLKNTPQESSTLEYTRKLFLFSYYCLGMSFQDMAYLTTRNMEKSDAGYYIVYKRRKLRNQKEAKNLKVPVTKEVEEILEWFKRNTLLVGDYLVPIVTKDYHGEKLYYHVLSRCRRYNLNLAKLKEVLKMEIPKLTGYVARHTVAMVLQKNKVHREIISQILGHTNLETTNVYLDSFETSVVDKVAELL